MPPLNQKCKVRALFEIVAGYCPVGYIVINDLNYDLNYTFNLKSCHCRGFIYKL